jgi:hypothetical protein
MSPGLNLKMSDASLPPIALTFAALVITMYLWQYVRNRRSISSNLFGLPLPLVNIREGKVLSEELIKAMNLVYSFPSLLSLKLHLNNTELTLSSIQMSLFVSMPSA